MYTNILIPTDGSELAGKAVQDGIALAKRIGAKVAALTVLPPFHMFTTDTQMLEDTSAQYKTRIEERAMLTLGTVANAAEAEDVACETAEALAQNIFALHWLRELWVYWHTQHVYESRV